MVWNAKHQGGTFVICSSFSRVEKEGGRDGGREGGTKGWRDGWLNGGTKGGRDGKEMKNNTKKEGEKEVIFALWILGRYCVDNVALLIVVCGATRKLYVPVLQRKQALALADELVFFT